MVCGDWLADAAAGAAGDDASAACAVPGCVEPGWAWLAADDAGPECAVGAALAGPVAILVTDAGASRAAEGDDLHPASASTATATTEATAAAVCFFTDSHNFPARHCSGRPYQYARRRSGRRADGENKTGTLLSERACLAG
jgi:hypothetical protein